jgi:hypothetical protein
MDRVISIDESPGWPPPENPIGEKPEKPSGD